MKKTLRLCHTCFTVIKKNPDFEGGYKESLKEGEACEVCGDSDLTPESKYKLPFETLINLVLTRGVATVFNANTKVVAGRVTETVLVYEGAGLTLVRTIGKNQLTLLIGTEGRVPDDDLEDILIKNELVTRSNI